MYECETCDEEFWDQYEWEDHMDDFDHWPRCETCAKPFYTERACEQHMDDKAHWAPRFHCETCNKPFLSQGAANQHMTDVGHWTPKIPCQTCGAKFYTQHAADQHMTAKNHYKHYCKDCDQQFKNENNLKMHLNSRVHRGTEISCPFCRAKYTLASGVVSHIETGSCPSAPKLNHATILRMIRERDTHGMITDRSIGWQAQGNVEYTATNRAYNGSYWECYICHKEFGKMSSLNSHLNSPVHQGKVYHCPNKARCVQKFVSLAAFFAHLESEKCAFMRFEKVQQRVGDVLQRGKLIGFS